MEQKHHHVFTLYNLANYKKAKFASIVTQVTDVETNSEPSQFLRTRKPPPSAPLSPQGFYRKKNCMLPPMEEEMKGRKTLVLDLDETLVHSSFQEVENVDIIIPVWFYITFTKVVLDGEEFNVFVLKRPGVDKFLAEMCKYYEIVIYTASLSLYADPLLDELDPYGHISFRLFREHCTFLNNTFVKDLEQLGRNLKSVIIVDNSPVCYSLQPENAIPILTWIDDQDDTMLNELTPLLKSLSRVGDVRFYIPRLIKDDDVDYVVSANQLKNELEASIKAPAIDNWVNSSKTKTNKPNKNNIRGQRVVPAAMNAIQQSTIIPLHLRSASHTLQKPGAISASHELHNKLPESSIKQILSRTPTTIGKNLNSGMKKTLPNHQPRQASTNNITSKTKETQIPLNKKVYEHEGRPSTARCHSSNLYSNLMQNKGGEFYKPSKFNKGKPVIIASSLAKNSIKKVIKNPSSVADRSKKGISDQDSLKSTEAKNPQSITKITELNKYSRGKATIRANGKKTPTIKYTPSELMKFRSNTKGLSKDKNGNSLVFNAIQMAESISKRPITHTHKKQ